MVNIFCQLSEEDGLGWGVACRVCDSTLPFRGFGVDEEGMTVGVEVWMLTWDVLSAVGPMETNCEV